MTQQEYIYYRFIFMEYGRDILTAFIKDKNKFNLPAFKDISKEYVTLVKDFLNECNKDTPDEAKLKEHVALLGKQHYKMYLKLN
jgi:hypothetical protein